MSRRPLDRDYESMELTILQKTDKAVLVQEHSMKPKGWVAKADILKAQHLASDKPEHCYGRYKITAQRYVFKRAGLIK